jgi:hypothetical protein
MTTPERFEVLDGGATPDEREARLSEGADALVEDTTRASILQHPHLLLVIAATLMTLGISVILIGWAGAANATVVEEQVPYLISGGLLGVALATIGALTLFSHWLTVSIREARQRDASRRHDHDELMQALRTLTGALVAQEDTDGSTRSTRAQRPVRRAPRRP